MSEAEKRAQAPNRAYYDACVGAWRGEVDLVITDPARLGRAQMSRWDRARVWAMVASFRLFGRARIDTTVAFTRDDEVVHTTRLSHAGVPSFVSRETIQLDPDGARARITIRQRLFPLFWPARTEGPFDVTINEAATRATYLLTFLGCPMRQIGERAGSDRVVLVQETDWSRSVQHLSRVGPSP